MGKTKIVPYQPHYCSGGNTVVETWKESAVTRDGLRQMLTWVRYQDKKGKLAETVAQVVWIDQPFADAYKRYQ
jgi:hypothetical protein